MGWPWPFDSSSSSASSTTDSDPLRNLDPSLRSFLEKESPIKYNTPSPSPSPSSFHEPHPEANSDKSTTDAQPSIPTHFPDGRYNHLWKSYTPQASIERRNKSDPEKLSDMLGAYKERRAQIGSAAILNCALEQAAINDCFRAGSVAARLTLCRAEKREFERCYLVQSRFLRALGYLGAYDRPAEVDEEIQMHADSLYQEMLAREKATKDALERGELLPASDEYAMPVRAEARQEADLPLPPAEENMTALSKEALAKRLGGLKGIERVMEEKAIEMDARAAKAVAEKLNEVRSSSERERETRRKNGTQTMSDRFAGIFGR